MTNADMNLLRLPPEPRQAAYSVKRHGLDITDCDSEPVQTPGCVQAHGALLVLRLADLCVVQASDNAQAVLGCPVGMLLGQPVGALIGTDGEAQLRTLLLTQPVDRNPLYLLTLSGGFAGCKLAGMLDVTAHTMGGVVILEFEVTGRTDAVSPDYYALVKKTVTRLQTAASLSQFCDLAAEEIRELTGMDRVLVYKFHEDGHGEVFAESRRPDLDSWLGVNYPAEDVPKPARDIFSKIWLRPIPDMSDALAEMTPLVNPDTGQPLDMTYCFLRGVSLMCTQYYRNMGVAATLTMSIRRGEHLWGLISCLYYAGPKYHSYQVRSACEFLAQVISLQHHAAEDREHVAYRLKLEAVHRQLVMAAAGEGGLASLVNGSPSLLDGVDAGGAALYHQGRWRCLGATPDAAQLEGLGQWLSEAKFSSGSKPLYATVNLARAYSGAKDFAAVASGLLALPLSRSGRDLMLWFKPQTLQAVNWAGVPHASKSTVQGPNGPRPIPRRNFEVFVESVQESSLPWKQLELEAVAALRVQLVEIVVEQAERRLMLKAELARSKEELDVFKYVASHDIKEPLRGIHHYAFQLMEEAALPDEKDRTKLDRMRRLALRMDGLLESLLHFSQVGTADSILETVDLNEIVAEAVLMVGQPVQGQLELAVPRLLPTIQCNRAWCREIFVNIVSNALKYSDSALKRVEVGSIAAIESHPRPGCPQGSQQHTIYYVSDNGIGIPAKQFAQIFKLFKRLHGRDEYGGGTGAGLTVARKLVERHHGKLWLDSLPGKGTTFYFTLPGKDER